MLTWLRRMPAGRGSRWRGLVFVVLSVVVLAGVSGCAGPSFDAFSEELRFGDETVSDEQVTDRMRIPSGGLGSLIRADQIRWAREQRLANNGRLSAFNHDGAKYLRAYPDEQCVALSETYQEDSPSKGTWQYEGSACTKIRQLTWLEKSLWSMYEDQADGTIDWLSTSRNTLVASSESLETLRAGSTPDYGAWFPRVNSYMRVAQGLLIVAAAVSLVVVGVRMVTRLQSGLEQDSPLLGRMGWILLGVFMGSSAASIVLAFFSTSVVDNGVLTPALASWTPGGSSQFYVSDFIRMQVDPFLIIAALCGVVAAGFKLVTSQDGRELVPLGKAFMWAIVMSVCLAGGVNLFQGTIDTWTAGVLRNASGMMKASWESNTLAAASFFGLDGVIAVVLVVVMWICNLVSKLFAYLRAGMLPVMVGVAPMWAAMSWMESGKQAFAKIMGWLFAFLLYKPVAALLMSAACAIMTTAGANDDSQAITLMLTVGVIVLLPMMIKIIVPAVQSSVGSGGSGIMPAVLAGAAGGAASLAGTSAKGAGRLAGAGIRALTGRHKSSPSGAASGSGAPASAGSGMGGGGDGPRSSDGGAGGPQGVNGAGDGASTPVSSVSSGASASGGGSGVGAAPDGVSPASAPGMGMGGGRALPQGASGSATAQVPASPGGSSSAGGVSSPAGAAAGSSSAGDGSSGVGGGKDGERS
ncbi:MAG: hypothetical protein LKI21_07565 [Bifidobacterium crudilactis]|jgi:hypothetical protein|nr:hypothetical protein [Bifidobacterium crudilactis]